MKKVLLAVLGTLTLGLANVSFAGPDHMCKPISDEALRVIDTEKSVVVQTADGPVTITRVMTECAKNKGWLQPLVPSPGITPVAEMEVIEAISNPDIMLVDMRTQEWFIERTIPGAINIPYTEMAMRMEEFGCTKNDGKYNCDNAKVVLGFCNGPVCPQSPTGMKAMIREGFPAENIMYYRGGMLDWDALGLTTVQGDL